MEMIKQTLWKDAKVRIKNSYVEVKGVGGNLLTGYNIVFLLVSHHIGDTQEKCRDFWSFRCHCFFIFCPHPPFFFA